MTFILQGRQLKQLVPLLTQAFRKALQRKHVWPNYKVRYRPLLPNPFLHPSPSPAAFSHVKLEGSGLEVTVLQCTRLNVKLAVGSGGEEVSINASLQAVD